MDDVLKNQILADLQIHFTRKIRHAISDTGETADAVDIPNKDIVAILMTALMYEIVNIGVAIGMDEESFVKCAASGYRQMAPLVKKRMRKTKKSL